MWWSAPVSERPSILREPGDDLVEVLRGLGLEDDDGLWIDAGHTVAVARSPAGLFIGWLDVGWLAPDDPFSEMRDIAHIVERTSREVLVRDLTFAIAEAAQARAERLRDCDCCDERLVPGQMYGAASCHSCAVRTGEIGR